ncbi:MAG: hypothetical protein ABL958_10865 [Bdellovibrionia bacterium]
MKFLIAVLLILSLSPRSMAAHKVGDWIRAKIIDVVDGETTYVEAYEEIVSIKKKEITVRYIEKNEKGEVEYDEVLSYGELKPPPSTMAELDSFCRENEGMRSKTTLANKPVEICTVAPEVNDRYIYGMVPILGIVSELDEEEDYRYTYELVDFGNKAEAAPLVQPHQVGEWSRFKQTTIGAGRKIVRDVLQEVISVNSMSFTVRTTTKDLDGASEVQIVSYGVLAGPAATATELDKECRKYQGIRSKRMFGGKTTEVCKVQYHPQNILEFGMVPILGVVSRYTEEKNNVTVLELVDYKF